MAKYKTIIGRAELIDFPARLLTDVPAKTDTGAYLSAVHATDIKEITKKNGKKALSFNMLGGHASAPYNREIVVDNYTRKTVENSFGVQQERYVVTFKVKMAGKIFKTEFGLADRAKKAFPILLGRTLINKRFIVDTDIAHIDQKVLKKNLKEWLAKDDLDDSKEEE